ncbi:MAG: tRNA preQ1(34) S-adenosylmethionine ribosyltransferase-isomerase QueA, partial [Gammaproteobacteria bacterium]|nr:tRNA preQ1(34) S-adenosylmethionine ribosyltransferase-isomerase QueA [Gammaproteobacteria bacterium]
MRTADFDYELPPELIAQRPLQERSASRLLVLDDPLVDRRMRELPVLLEPGDLLVFNDTRVIPARLFARKPTGGRVELLVERLTDTHQAIAHVRSSKSLRAGQELEVAGGGRLCMAGRQGEYFEVESPDEPFMALLARAGHVPLPPYIDRPDEEGDRERYQSIFARVPGAVAAPTASLHFDEPLLAALAERGVNTATVTLHVGAGTFQPIRGEDPEVCRLHREWCEVSANTVTAIETARHRGARVVAVGTTVVRTLEAAAAGGVLSAWKEETSLFILPGFRFRVVDALVTNFHLPRSSLLMLVSAAAGRERVLAAYRHAVAGHYRFYSYGDAMFVPVGKEARG